MNATAVWTVHCDGCCRWDDYHESQGEANRAARAAGWLVTKEDNLCPNCKEGA